MKKNNKQALFEMMEKINSTFKSNIEEQKFSVGQKVKISDLSGVDSNKTGTIIQPSEIKVDVHGIPTNVSGAYKPVDWKKEVAIKLDDGNIITMFKNRIKPI